MNVKRALYGILLAALSATLLSGCGAEPQSGGGQQLSYKDMKSMVIDILKTEDAQKALQESQMSASGTSESGIKMLSMQDAESVRMAVKETITSPDYDKVIKTMMTDTRFAGEFAKAVNKQNKDIHKELMKDPAYQKELIAAMKTPEMDKMILEVLMSGQYRKQVMTIMQESMSNPLFRVEILDLLKKAVQEELRVKPEEKVDTKSSSGSGQEGGSGGEEGGGEEGSEESSEESST
ncbi:spore germination lipoprotein GerD [Paenibacillus pasadenensis]|uniref:Spore germination protein GerD n=1 Tax=Paenibacillus pasadenensis TaxID=217090 RepID=A0A2N5N1J1_9BACL|nr:MULTISPECIES: spore germination lipoprotein GerD [Paenibacillus]PLT44185.1 Spore germination protein GerD [Paenibacillus pasadenensis]QGG54715.1 spore gernimation protein [Paenibacillus sp. B01]